MRNFLPDQACGPQSGAPLTCGSHVNATDFCVWVAGERCVLTQSPRPAPTCIRNGGTPLLPLRAPPCHMTTLTTMSARGRLCPLLNAPRRVRSFGCPGFLGVAVAAGSVRTRPATPQPVSVFHSAAPPVVALTKPPSAVLFVLWASPAPSVASGRRRLLALTTTARVCVPGIVSSNFFATALRSAHRAACADSAGRRHVNRTDRRC